MKLILSGFFFFLLFNLATLKIKITYVAHVLFLLDSTGIEHERKKRDKKGNLNGVPQWGLSVVRRLHKGLWLPQLKGKIWSLKNGSIEW